MLSRTRTSNLAIHFLVAAVLAWPTGISPESFFARVPASRGPASDEVLDVAGKQARPAKRKCLQDSIVTLLKRVSDPDQTREYRPQIVKPFIAQAPSDKVKAVFTPQLNAVNANGQSMQMQVVRPEVFIQNSKELSNHGLWVLFSPSNSDARVASGHLRLVLTDTVFSRNVDEAGPAALTSAPLHATLANEESQNFLNNSYMVAQYFELSEPSVEALSKFMHDRVWFHHAAHQDYSSRYIPLPFTRDAQVYRGENCLTYVFCFYENRWTEIRPELFDIQNEIGTFKVNEIPARQVLNNTTAPSYRGTLLISNDPGRLKQRLLGPDIKEDHALSQLLLDKITPVAIGH